MVEPDLPELAWPLSEGGGKVQADAQQQTIELLSPYVEALKGDAQQWVRMARALPGSGDGAGQW